MIAVGTTIGVVIGWFIAGWIANVLSNVELLSKANEERAQQERIQAQEQQKKSRRFVNWLTKWRKVTSISDSPI